MTTQETADKIRNLVPRLKETQEVITYTGGRSDSPCADNFETEEVLPELNLEALLEAFTNSDIWWNLNGDTCGCSKIKNFEMCIELETTELWWISGKTYDQQEKSTQDFVTQLLDDK